MFILSSVPNGLKFWLVIRTYIYENSELKIFKNEKVLSEIFTKWLIRSKCM